MVAVWSDTFFPPGSTPPTATRTARRQARPGPWPASGNGPAGLSAAVPRLRVDVICCIPAQSTLPNFNLYRPLDNHVEVKGTTGAATSVELTINEVLHARDKDNTVDLYVVSDIKVDTLTDPYTASGNKVTLFTDWEPAEEDLRPRKYEYRLPDTTN
ncbi:DUF3883 domain-containing protein [Streptomyces sp. NPDC005373]|uniref:protein NO VEIN domain-containing protein n=1 Tax=Streptomyces sp. NPDC005373 TaxID=3156879 RepID=UPI0033BC00DC